MFLIVAFTAIATIVAPILVIHRDRFKAQGEVIHVCMVRPFVTGLQGRGVHAACVRSLRLCTSSPSIIIIPANTTKASGIPLK